MHQKCPSANIGTLYLGPLKKKKKKKQIKTHFSLPVNLNLKLNPSAGIISGLIRELSFVFYKGIHLLLLQSWSGFSCNIGETFYVCFLEIMQFFLSFVLNYQELVCIFIAKTLVIENNMCFKVDILQLKGHR